MTLRPERGSACGRREWCPKLLAKDEIELSRWCEAKLQLIEREPLKRELYDFNNIIQNHIVSTSHVKTSCVVCRVGKYLPLFLNKFVKDKKLCLTLKQQFVPSSPRVVVKEMYVCFWV